MSLFDKEKELIFKITNAILLIWFVAAVALSFSSAITLLVPGPTEEQQIKDCINNDDTEEAKIKCEEIYDFDYSKRYDVISFYTSIANVLIVGSSLYFLNRKKEH